MKILLFTLLFNSLCFTLFALESGGEKIDSATTTAEKKANLSRFEIAVGGSYFGIKEQVDNSKEKAETGDGYLASGFIYYSTPVKPWLNFAIGPVFEWGNESSRLTTDSMIRFGGSMKYTLTCVPFVSPYSRVQISYHSNHEAFTRTQIRQSASGLLVAGANTIDVELTASGLVFDFLIGFDYSLFDRLKLFVEGGLVTGSIIARTNKAILTNTSFPNGRPFSIVDLTVSISGFRAGGGITFQI